jgi:hypothetical protein
MGVIILFARSMYQSIEAWGEEKVKIVFSFFC